MATLTKFYDLADQLGRGKHDFSSHTLKVALTNTAPTTANAVLADITEIAAAGGYTAGGYALTTAWAESGGIGKLTITDKVITATGASVGPFQYAVIYNSTQTSPLKPLIGFIDYGSSITLADTETYTLNFDDTGGALTIQ